MLGHEGNLPSESHIRNGFVEVAGRHLLLPLQSRNDNAVEGKGLDGPERVTVQRSNHPPIGYRLQCIGNRRDEKGGGSNIWGDRHLDRLTPRSDDDPVLILTK